MTLNDYIVALFYAKSFLQSALRPEAPFNDLNLIKGMREYAKHQPEVVVQPLMFWVKIFWRLGKLYIFGKGIV